MSMKWHKVAASPEEIPFSQEGLAEVQAGGKTVCIANFRFTLGACAAKCPHVGGRLSEGYLDNMGHLVCPVHRYKFNMATGRNVSGEGYYLKIYPMEIRDDGVWVAV